ncbi:MAG TPA: AAA family ATPase [Candidatus Dormibacteraeota bacterium]
MTAPDPARSRGLLLVQMAGSPGTGKSALAAGLGHELGAVVLDKDVVKSALLEAGAGWELAGGAANEAMFEIAGSLLGQGLSVILDGPSHYPVIPMRGEAVALGHQATYRLIECVCEDLEEVGRRLAGRSARRSQWPALGSQSPDGSSRAEAVGPHRWRTHGPAGGWLVLDTSRPVPASLAAALAYLG